MSTLLQDQIALLKEQLAGYQSEVPQNTDKINALTNRIGELEAELGATQQEVAERQQLAQDTIDTYVDTLGEMFQALFPSEVFKQVMGITDYEEKRAQFYQLNHAYFAEKIDELHKQSELSLAMKDERIRLLSIQSLKVQEQLDEANNTIAELNTKNAELENENAKLQEKETALTTEKEHLNSQVQDLTAQLEAAKQPKVEKSSQKLTDMMSEIKSKNTTSADEWIARWNARQKSEDAKIPVATPPAVEGGSFRDEQAGASESNGDQLPATQEAPAIIIPGGGVFPSPVITPEVPAVEPPVVDGQPGGETQDAPKTIGERIADLEQRVAALEGKGTVNAA